jgi:hypothetical protein
MLPDLRLNLECFERLMAWDEELARQVAAARCPHCGGPRHQAQLPAKTAGWPARPGRRGVPISALTLLRTGVMPDAFAAASAAAFA